MKKAYDLEERTLKYAEKVIDLAKNTKTDIYNESILKQLIRSSSSVGANYSEANEAESKKDFIHKINLAKKEAKETIHWLKIIKATTITNMENLEKLKGEAQELVLIFSKIISTTKKK